VDRDDKRDGLSAEEKENVADLASPRSVVIYEVVRRQGDEELVRPNSSLFWSGIAAGVTIMASVIAEGALRQKIPVDTSWRDLVSDLGYSVGFLMVILGRMQLFTEQTIVTVLPLMADMSWQKLVSSCRLWAIVFAANMVGTFAAAGIIVYAKLVGPNLLAAMLEVSSKLLDSSPTETAFYAIPAGFLMASVAWIRAGAADGEFWIILTLTYLIALGAFTHVVAGSAEAFLLLFAGKASIIRTAGGMILPALIGNIIGGTGLFALLAHAQVRREL
jgi:formate-nitrite transporter family protein